MGENRFYGIDTWRAFLLLIGPAIHAAELSSRSNGGVIWLDVVGYGSHIFRMEAFFVLAGFLAAISQRKGSGWLKRRSIQLAVPLATAWLTLIPLCAYIRYRMMGESLSAASLGPNYLWFLITLLLLSPVGKLLDEAGTVKKLAGAADRSPRDFWRAAAGAWFAVILAERVLLHLFKPGEGLLAILIGAPYYGFFYFAGLVTARSSVTAAHLSVTRWWPIGPLIWGCAIAFFYQTQTMPALHDGTTGRAIAQALAGLAALTMGYTVLATALRIRVADKVVRVLVDAAYTIYVVHMPAVLAFGWMLSATDVQPGVMFLLSAVGAIGVSLLFHLLVVRDLAWASFLFNGRTLPHPRSSPGQIGATVAPGSVT